MEKAIIQQYADGLLSAAEAFGRLFGHVTSQELTADEMDERAKPLMDVLLEYIDND